MKAYWHTKTLFIQAGKYKWSYKHDHCIECKCVKFKHKWRWLCTSCWEKERDKDPKRKEQKYKAGHKWHTINNPSKPREEWKPMWTKKRLTPEQRKEYQREWARKWSIAINAIRKGATRHKKWLPCVQYMDVFLPFETLSKPFESNFTCTEKEYEEWIENIKIFDEVRKYKNK